jgi:hypothetical protein
MIKRYTDNNVGNSDSISVKYQKLQLFASACNILKELGFKTSHIQDKIKVTYMQVFFIEQISLFNLKKIVFLVINAIAIYLFNVCQRIY